MHVYMRKREKKKRQTSDTSGNDMWLLLSQASPRTHSPNWSFVNPHTKGHSGSDDRHNAIHPVLLDLWAFFCFQTCEECSISFNEILSSYSSNMENLVSSIYEYIFNRPSHTNAFFVGDHIQKSPSSVHWWNSTQQICQNPLKEAKGRAALVTSMIGLGGDALPGQLLRHLHCSSSCPTVNDSTSRFYLQNVNENNQYSYFDYNHCLTLILIINYARTIKTAMML